MSGHQTFWNWNRHRRKAHQRSFEHNHWFHKHNRRISRHELYLMHRLVHALRVFEIFFTLGIICLLFKAAGFITVVLVISFLLVMKQILSSWFHLRLENNVFKAIEQLKDGVDEIAKGNYQVQIDFDILNEVGQLTAAFNKMARQLAKDEKIKAEYEENRKALIANISHDLKTPITSIQGYVEALSEESIPVESRKPYLQIILHNTVYMNKLIDDLFLFSKLDMQKLEFNLVKTSIRAYMNDLAEELGLELEERGVRFIYIDQICSLREPGEPQEELSVYLDGKRMYQALCNIVGNAVKYGPKEGLIIETVLSNEEDHVCISIKDNGPGISEKDLPYIFNRFYRIDQERTKDILSTGLGLAIAKELVEAHGGSIEATCEEGQGVCLIMTLPLLTPESTDHKISMKYNEKSKCEEP